MIIDEKTIAQLQKVDMTLRESIAKDVSEYEKNLNLFETVQVHTGCGGCFGTQMCKGAAVVAY